MLPRPPLALVLPSLMLAACSSPRPPQHPGSDRPPVQVRSDDEYAALRADYDGLEISDPRRPSLRAGLAAYALGDARRELAAGRADAAFDGLREQVLTLWDYEDFGGADAGRPDSTVAGLRAIGEDLEKVFRRRGDHQRVLATLAVQIGLAPGEATPRARWGEVTAWLREDPTLPRAESGAVPAPCSAKACRRLLEDLEAAVTSWPAPFLVDELARLYEERPSWISSATRGNPADLAEMLSERSLGSPAYDVARLQLRASRPEAALAALDRLSPAAGSDGAPLRDALRRYLSPQAKAADAIDVARPFARADALRFREVGPHDALDGQAAQRICEDAARRFPTAAEPRLCAGELAEQRGRLGRALAHYEAVRGLDPGRRDAWESLARLHQRRLVRLVGDEKTAELPAELQRIEELHAEAARRFPGAPLHFNLADALYEVGQGFYNAGRIDDAVSYYEKSVTTQKSVPGFEQLGVIALKRGDGKKALRSFEDALAVASTADPHEFLSARARLARGQADAYDLLEQGAEAERVRRQAADDFALILTRGRNGLRAEEIADNEMERGKVLYQLGRREQALVALERAIDALPDRGATYADLLAFLVPRGERDEALDAYHRALGRAEVSEYLKVYCSMWIVDLDRRAGEPEDPLARAFLEGMDGGKWYHDLARWATGRQSQADLDAHARTSSNRAEAWFYEAMRQLERGQLEEAKALWKKVIDTQMMAFFEYDMAAYYLRHGATAKPAPPRPSAAPPKGAPPARIPDGSI